MTGLDQAMCLCCARERYRSGNMDGELACLVKRHQASEPISRALSADATNTMPLGGGVENGRYDALMVLHNGEGGNHGLFAPDRNQRAGGAIWCGLRANCPPSSSKAIDNITRTGPENAART